MANSIELAKKFLPIIDDIYKNASFTAQLDTPQMPGWFGGANEIKVLKASTTGLGNYNRQTGYPGGDVTATWETMKLSQERGKKINVDRMDDEETLGMTFGYVVGNFMRDHVIPELDAYRFSRYCTKAGGTASGALDKETILAAIDTAGKGMDEGEVPQDGRILFVNTNLKPALSEAIGRMLANESAVNTIVNNYNGMPIVYVNPGRFYSQITLNDGTSTYGFTKTATTGKDINFLIVRKDAVVQGVKFSLPKIFSPDVNQEMDAWMFQFRNYHDAFVYENKTKGIYAHIAAA